MSARFECVKPAYQCHASCGERVVVDLRRASAECFHYAALAYIGCPYQDNCRLPITCPSCWQLHIHTSLYPFSLSIASIVYLTEAQ
eukprot:17254-Heterococcus_DN1.PRE.1